MTEKHLWEYDHPYYCSESNYYARADETFEQYENWSEFVDEAGGMSKNLNLLFRWDWKRPTAEDLKYLEEDGEYTGDMLQLFFMAQRKGLFFINFVKVTEEDEDSVRMFLRGYADHMRVLWEPLLDEAKE